MAFNVSLSNIFRQIINSWWQRKYIYVRLKKDSLCEIWTAWFPYSQDVNEEQKTPKKDRAAAKNEKEVTEGKEKPKSRK